VNTLIENYGPYFQQIEERDGDVAFRIKDTWIYYRNGKMLKENHFHEEDQFNSIFFNYPIGKLTQIPPYQEIPRRSSDFLDLLFGEREMEIRRHCQLVSFLDHKAFVNRICLDALKKVEAEIQQSARIIPEVKNYIQNLHIVYSFQQKQVVGSTNTSYHSYGLAIDLVPKSYQGKQVYWKWSRVFDKKWHEIPLEKRWSPPQEIIDAFEDNGFIWGGKWSHFDTIHFEYRPEIIRLTQMRM